MNRTKIISTEALLATLFASSVGILGVTCTLSALALPAAAPAAQATASTPTATAVARSSPTQASAPAKGTSAVGGPVSRKLRMSSKSAEMYYDLIWGVDSLRVKYAESGEIIRFSYRVLDVQKARALNDKKNEPSLIDPKAGVELVVPSMEKVGKLRQAGTPQAGKMYWMAFSNKGRLVKPGDHVNVVIGTFQANGLVVE
jgi:hypothetical protein